MFGVSHKSRKARRILKRLQTSIDTVQRFRDDTGKGFWCFPYAFDAKNLACTCSDSPVCELCRRIHGV